MNRKAAGQQYQQINAQTGIVDADPHKLIQMLFAGALDSIAAAKGCIERDDVAGKGAAIGKAIDIVGGLADSVNTEVAGELSGNLSSLYDFVTRCLSAANLNNDINQLNQATNVLKELQAGWNEIRPQVLATQAAAEPA